MLHDVFAAALQRGPIARAHDGLGHVGEEGVIVARQIARTDRTEQKNGSDQEKRKKIATIFQVGSGVELRSGKELILQYAVRTSMKLRRLIPLLIGLAAASLPLWAHHSFAAEYDAAKPIKVTGVVTRVEWQNPHIWFYVDVKDENGKVTNWAFSGGAPGQLMRRGITHAQIQTGMTIMVEGFLAKDGSHNGSGAKVTFPDGRSVFTAGAEDKLPGDKK